MAPTLSSSAPSTPAGKATSANGMTLPAPQSTPRKVPHCTKCHRPRAGHPRQGCPYIDSPSPGKVEEDITDALESLHIETQNMKVPDVRRPRRSAVKPTPVLEASLESLPRGTSTILNGLLKPGMMSNEVEEDERRASVTRWQNMITAEVQKVSARMPGTLNTPTTTSASLDDGLSSLMFGTKGPLQNADEQKKPSIRMPGSLSTPSIAEDFVATQESTASQGDSASSKHVMRSMSMEEREAFLNELVQSSKVLPATVFVLPIDEIPEAQKSATERGFYCRVHDLENGDGWLIIGMDGQAVDALLVGVEGDAKDKSDAGGGFRAVVGGVIVGSMATWTGLAYS